jgi:hypothetical protein
MIIFSLVVANGKGNLFIIDPPIWEYYADPFFLEVQEDKCTIIFERYSRIKKKGKIAIIEVDFRDRSYQLYDLLEERHHLSYPCPIEVGGVKYFLPESSASRNLSLYQLHKSNEKYFAFKMNTIDGNYVDATYLVDKNQRKYLYYYDGRSNNDGLLYKQEVDILANNHLTLVGDPNTIGNLRPGGLISQDIQPFQNNKGRYGEGLIFIRNDNFGSPIILTNLNRFLDKYIDYTHHVHLIGDYCVIDLRSSKIKIRNILKRAVFSSPNSIIN